MVLLIVFCGVSFLLFTGILLKTTNRTLSIDRIVVLSVAVFCGILFPLVYYVFSFGIGEGTYAKSIAAIEWPTVLEYYACASLTVIGIACVFSMQKRNILSIVTDRGNQSQINDNQIVWINWLLLIIGITCSYLYYRAYGGYTNYLQYSRKVRMGIFPIYNRFSFLIIFRNFSVLAAYLAFARVFSKKKTKISDVFLLGISTAYAIMTLYSNFGRMSFAFFFLILMLFFVIRKQEDGLINTKLFLSMGLVVVGALVGLFVSGELLGRNDEENILKELVGEVSFPFHNFTIASQYVESGERRYFMDLVIWPAFLLPTSIWNDKLGIQTSSNIMTIITTGSSKGENGVYGELPVDLLSQLYMQLGFIGVCLAAAGWCYWGCRMLSWVENNIESQDTKRMLKIYILVEYFLRSIMYCDPSHIVQRMFPFIAFMMMFSVWRRTINQEVRITLRGQ